MATEYIITQEDLNQGNEYLKTLTTEHPVCRIADGVTSIGNSVFQNCINLTNLILPDSLTSIGYRAFMGTSITSINIPAETSSIAPAVFYECKTLESITVDEENEYYRSTDGILYNKDKTKLITCPANILLSSFTIPSSVTYIDEYAFYGCKNLTSINIGRVKYIYDSAFEGCSSLESINIPKTVKTIGNNVFKGCTNLKTITVDADNPEYISTDGILYNKNKMYLITCPANILLSSFTIPSSVNTIDNGAFQGCTNLKEITIPNSVTFIGSSAFNYCNNLISITIPNSVEAIGRSAFSGCTNLTSINIPSSVTFIGNGAFEDCSNLQTINVDLNFNQTLLEGKVPSNTKILISCTGEELRDKLFTYDSSIYTRIINDTTHDGFYVDENAGTISIHNVTITNNLLTQLFYPWSDSITEVDLSGVDLSRVRIFDALFQDCHALETVDLSNWNITTDETVSLVNMFAGSGIKNVILPNLKVKYIDGMFSNCYMLEELDLSNLDVSQVTRMDRLFENCSKLKTLNLTGWDTSKVEDMSSMFEGCEGFDSLKM